MLAIDFNDEVIIILAQALINRFGKDHVLLVPQFKEALVGMPQKGRIWAAVVGDDLLIGIDAVGEHVVEIEDLREAVERETVH